MKNLTLLPRPRHLQQTGGSFGLPQHGTILIPGPDLLFEAQWLRDSLTTAALAYTVGLHAHDDPVVRLRVDAALAPQAYRLTIDADGVQISGGDAAGVFYGLTTLRQIILNVGRTLPTLVIDDQPDMLQRGYMLDISRDRVPTRATLLQLIDELAALKYNQLQLYTEHTFAYPGHRMVWELADPLTSEDVLLLDQYCRQRHIELVPNQNSLGHMERWLKHAPYRHLAESPDGFIDPAGRKRGPSTMAPLEPGSFDLMRGLYDVLLPHFASRRVNVGCDEPWDLGQGKSKDAVAARGGRVYFEWLMKLYENLAARGCQMMFWGDIIINHPELIPELPGDILVMEWGYEANHPFEAHCRQYAEAEIPFYVCPGTSSWNALTGRAPNAVGNVRQAVRHGLDHGAQGMLLTDWGDNGHWQPYPASYTGIVAAAGMAWCFDRNQDPDLRAALDVLIYRDSAGIMGALTVDLGSIYQQIGPPHINGQVLAYALQWNKHERDDRLKQVEEWGGAPTDISPENLHRVIARINAIVAPLQRARMDRTDAALLQQEWAQAAALLQHGAKWLSLMQEAPDYSAGELLHDWETRIVQQRELWLARSRRGGLEDSMRRFDILRDAYRELMD
ncbi:MAG: glycoside hydrolase family 20 zincin-like fold domain-containing protein [Chloroflexota bacterium]